MKSTIFFLILISFFVTARSQKFYNEELSKIYSRLQVPSVHTNHDTTIDLIGIDSCTYHLIYQNSQISHIGLKIFPDTFTSDSRNLIYRFIERKLLLYKLFQGGHFIENDLKNSNCLLVFNGIEFGQSGFEEYSSANTILSSFKKYKIYSDSLNIIIKLSTDEANLIFYFRRNFYTVAGLNKIQADDFLFEQVKTYNPVSSKNESATNSKKLIKLNDSVFNVQGSDFLKILSNSYYVLKKEDRYQILDDLQYPKETFVSSILHPENEKLTTNVVLEHKQYSKGKKQLVSLPNLINYLRQGHELYFGIEDTSTTLAGTLIAYNKELNYLHLFYFITTKTVLFSSNREYACKLYSFIPTDNVKDLFAIEVNENKSYKEKMK